MTRSERARLKMMALKTAKHRPIVAAVLPARMLWLCLATVMENTGCEPAGRDLAARIMGHLDRHISDAMAGLTDRERAKAWVAMEATLDLWVEPYRKAPGNPHVPEMSSLLLSVCHWLVLMVEEGLYSVPDDGSPFALAYDELTSVIAMHPDFRAMERAARRRAREMLERAQGLCLYKPAAEVAA